MMPARAGRCALLVLSLAGCADERGRQRGWHDEPPRLVVQVASAASLRLVRAVRVLAPPIRFAALVEPDPHHGWAVTAPIEGKVVRIDSTVHARRDRSVALVRPRSAQAGAASTVVAPTDGTWRPRRSLGEFVWRGDTLGVVWEHGYFLAVGSVDDLVSAFVHRDDPATVQAGDGRVRSGRVERVFPPGSFYPYSTQVAVEFAIGEDSAGSGAMRAAEVTVMPRGAQDSIVAVPAAAIVRLALGHAVFVPAGGGRYEVRWITPGPRVGSLVTVRDGLEAGVAVVAGGIERLALAARDSLARDE